MPTSLLPFHLRCFHGKNISTILLPFSSKSWQSRWFTRSILLCHILSSYCNYLYTNFPLVDVCLRSSLGLSGRYKSFYKFFLYISLFLLY
ncbi:hypothetical protein VNO80_31605 [Phaseolus coccineus]|uniref:Uncharacterized protein n=1 Tax=Phaseolus coccineus TaxID=3886 RepID=A0AAN9L0G6_PHACN